MPSKKIYDVRLFAAVVVVVSARRRCLKRKAPVWSKDTAVEGFDKALRDMDITHPKQNENNHAR